MLEGCIIAPMPVRLLSPPGSAKIREQLLAWQSSDGKQRLPSADLGAAAASGLYFRRRATPGRKGFHEQAGGVWPAKSGSSEQAVMGLISTVSVQERPQVQKVG